MCHMYFQGSLDVFGSWHFVQENDVESEMGPGRRGQRRARLGPILGNDVPLTAPTLGGRPGAVPVPS